MKEMIYNIRDLPEGKKKKKEKKLLGSERR